MKKLFTIALFALLAAVAAEAKTYYVDASRPNNNGNGLKPESAKKTIQAAVNLAKQGDTILVYPGTYAPIKTQNKRIAVKAVKGARKTRIAKPAKVRNLALAQLGKTGNMRYQGTRSTFLAPFSAGRNTTLAGFLLDGGNRDNGYCTLIGISGGTAKSCSVQRLGREGPGPWLDPVAAANAALAACSLLNNHAILTTDCVLSHCRIGNNQAWNCAITDSRLANCLIAGNRYTGTSGRASHFRSSVLVNCTIADNRTGEPRAPFSRRSKFRNCILRNNRRCDARDDWRGGASIHNVDPDNSYRETDKNNRNPKFVTPSARLSFSKRNYRLRNGSYAIDKGKLDAGQQKLVGKKDLDGRKRIRGKAIDLGCYEH